LPGEPKIVLQKCSVLGAAADRFHANDAGAGKEVEKGPIRYGVAQDAEQRLAHHLRRWPKLRGNRAGDFSATQLAGHNANLGSLRSSHDAIFRTSAHGAPAVCRSPARRVTPARA